MLERSLVLPTAGSESFFLWGPRQTGKTTLLRAAYPDSTWLDLLRADEYRRYLQHPERLREELTASPAGHVVIDEVQKVPQLLDEVHWLIENSDTRFALCGSSARKVRRGGANLLGGRAVTYELHGLTALELAADFDLDRLLNHGTLPRHYLAERPQRQLDAYASTYLREEVAAEALVRSVPTFARFLDVAALSDTEMTNYSTIARECGVSSTTIKSYYEILVDTLIGRFLPGYTARPKRRVIAAPKFYFADVGVVNHLARRGTIQRGSELFGKAFENWVFHELVAWNAYAERGSRLSYWRLPSGIEVDFIVDDMALAVEAKASANVTGNHLKGLRELRRDHPELQQLVVVSLEPRARRTDDGILVLPALDWCRRLAAGDLGV